MSDVFFTSDTHFSHFNIISYVNRPFSSVEEMNETIIMNWNSKVKNDDRIYHLGDVGFDPLEPILKRLNGDKVLIIGSHDKDALRYPQYFKQMTPLLNIVVEDQPITLCHHAMRSWRKSFHGSFHLFGHSHGRLEPLGKSFDVGVDMHKFFPWSFEEIKTKMNYLNNNKD